MSLIVKKVTAQNLPYFHQNSLKIFLNLTDCWKKNMATMDLVAARQHILFIYKRGLS